MGECNKYIGLQKSTKDCSGHLQIAVSYKKLLWTFLNVKCFAVPKINVSDGTQVCLPISTMLSLQ
jgi:hypothetical protein